MTKHFMLLSLTLSALLFAQPARAAAETSPKLISPALQEVYHFPVCVSDVTWYPGCVEPYRNCRGGLFMSYTLEYIDLSLNYVEDVWPLIADNPEPDYWSDRFLETQWLRAAG